MDLKWRKSSRSDAQGGNCVEVATNVPSLVVVRDSKDPDGPMLSVDPAEWHRFVTSLR